MISKASFVFEDIRKKVSKLGRKFYNARLDNQKLRFYITLCREFQIFPAEFQQTFFYFRQSDMIPGFNSSHFQGCSPYNCMFKKFFEKYSLQAPILYDLSCSRKWLSRGYPSVKYWVWSDEIWCTDLDTIYAFPKGKATGHALPVNFLFQKVWTEGIRNLNILLQLINPP